MILFRKAREDNGRWPVDPWTVGGGRPRCSGRAELGQFRFVEVFPAAHVAGAAQGLQLPLPRRAASALLFFGSLSMFVYLAHVPALCGLSRYVDAGALRFSGAVILSLIMAQALKKATDVIVYRFVR